MVRKINVATNYLTRLHCASNIWKHNEKRFTFDIFIKLWQKAVDNEYRFTLSWHRNNTLEALLADDLSNNVLQHSPNAQRRNLMLQASDVLTFSYTSNSLFFPIFGIMLMSNWVNWENSSCDAFSFAK